MKFKKIKSCILGITTMAVACLPFAVSTSCNHEETIKEFHVIVSNGFTLSNKKLAKQGEPWSSDLIKDTDNNKVVIGITVKKDDDTVLELNKDYSWNILESSSSLVGNITINNPSSNISIFVETIEKTSEIIYNGESGYIYPQINDDFEFLYLDSVLPNNNKIEILINSVKNLTHPEEDLTNLLSVISVTDIIDRRFNIQIGLNDSPSFSDDFIECSIEIKFNYTIGSSTKKELVATVPVEIYQKTKDKFIFPSIEKEDEKYTYLVGDAESLININFILNEKRAPISNKVFVSLLPEYTSKVSLLTTVCDVQPFHDYFTFNVSLKLPQKTYLTSEFIPFGLNFSYSRSNYTVVNCNTLNDKYQIWLKLDLTVLKHSDTNVIIDQKMPSFIQLSVLHPNDYMISNPNEAIRVELKKNDAISQKFKVNTVKWHDTLGLFLLDVYINSMSSVSIDDEMVTLDLYVKDSSGGSEVQLDNTSWTSPTYDLMACNPVTDNFLKYDGDVLTGFSSSFDMSKPECQKFNALIIPEHTTRIENKAFYGYAGYPGEDLRLKNSNIKWLILPNKSIYENPRLKEIGYCAFEQCTNFTGILYIPSSIELIDDCAFKDCSNFDQLLFATGAYGETESNLKTIKLESFRGFANASIRNINLKLPYGLVSLGIDSFKDTTMTGNITLPITLKPTEDYEFARGFLYNASFSTISLLNKEGTVERWAFPKQMFDKANDYNNFIGMPHQDGETYLELWPNIEVRYGAFARSRIEKLVIHKQWYSSGTIRAKEQFIHQSAFWGCNFLKIIDISEYGPDDLNNLNILCANGKDCFEYCGIGVSEKYVVVNDDVSPGSDNWWKVLHGIPAGYELLPKSQYEKKLSKNK